MLYSYITLTCNKSAGYMMTKHKGAFMWDMRKVIEQQSSQTKLYIGIPKYTITKIP